MTTPLLDSAHAGLPVIQEIPTNLLSPGVMSDTSSSLECFVNQRFSAKLQAFLISYVNSISSNYGVFEI